MKCLHIPHILMKDAHFYLTTMSKNVRLPHIIMKKTFPITKWKNVHLFLIIMKQHPYLSYINEGWNMGVFPTPSFPLPRPQARVQSGKEPLKISPSLSSDSTHRITWIWAYNMILSTQYYKKKFLSPLPWIWLNLDLSKTDNIRRLVHQTAVPSLTAVLDV